MLEINELADFETVIQQWFLQIDGDSFPRLWKTWKTRLTNEYAHTNNCNHSLWSLEKLLRLSRKQPDGKKARSTFISLAFYFGNSTHSTGLKPSTFQLWGLNANRYNNKKKLNFPDSVSPVELFVSTGYVCWEAVVVVTADRSHSFALSLSHVRLGIFILDSVKDHTACRQDSKPRGIVVNGPRRVCQRSFSAAAAATIKCF